MTRQFGYNSIQDYTFKWDSGSVGRTTTAEDSHEEESIKMS